MSQSKPVEINMTARDGIQSNHGTNIPAEHVVQAYAHAHDYGVSSVQTAGGTFHDLPVKKGWNPFDYNGVITDHFKGMTQTALIRGECGLNYGRQSLDTLDYLVTRYSEMGINRWQNFHAMNDINMLRGVPLITNRLQSEKGLNVVTQGAITVQENPNTQAQQQRILDDIYTFANQLVETGHKGFYIKNANGILRPDFTAALVEGLNQRFDEDTHLHMHNTYGHAYANYLAAIEAGITGVDVLPDALGEGTAQPTLGMLVYAMQKSGNDSVIARLPAGIDMDAIAQDRDAMLVMRATYSQTEMPFDIERIRIAEAAGSAGGAISALKGMEIIQGVAQSLGTEDWDTLQRAIYEQKAKNREALGFPTNVTPHEMMQDVQAAADVMTGQQFKTFSPTTLAYLVGDLGKVSDTVDPALQKRALDFFKLDAVRPLKPIEELEPALPKAKAKLIEKGIANPTDDQVAIVASSGADGEKLVLGQKAPQNPRYLLRAQQEGGPLYEVAPTMFKIVYDAVELTKLREGFYDGVNGQDERAKHLEATIAADVQFMEACLKDDGCDRHVARKATGYINTFAKRMGVDSAIIPNMDLASFPRGPVTINPALSQRKGLEGVLDSSEASTAIGPMWQKNTKPETFEDLIDEEGAVTDLELAFVSADDPEHLGDSDPFDDLGENPTVQ